MSPRGGVIKHGHTRDFSTTRTYRTWQGLQGRCDNPTDRAYPRYGGRGITICDRWRGSDGFVNFLADMGERPEGKTLDRIDNNGSYSPENCRWATTKQQGRNRCLGPTQRVVLQVLEGGPKGPREVAYDCPSITKHNASETIRHLYNRALIDVHHTEAGRRLYALTEKGRNALHGLGYRPVNDLHDAIFDALQTGADRKRLHREIDRICDEIEASVCERCEGSGRETF